MSGLRDIEIEFQDCKLECRGWIEVEGAEFVSADLEGVWERATEITIHLDNGVLRIDDAECQLEPGVYLVNRRGLYERKQFDVGASS